jgi:HAE1 family hydrophobic/amphiphilic exporter-1
MAPPTFHAVRGLSGEPLKLTVREAVFATVARNLDVRLRMDDREIAASEIFIQYGIYDPVLAASITKQRSENIGAFDLEGPSSQSVTTTTSEAGIAQRLPIGTLLEIAAFDQRTDLSPSSMSLNPTYDSGLGIQATQPLLQNFGTLVNNANIMIASRQLDQANLAFRRELEVRIGEVLSAYWNLDFALRNLDARVQSLVAARELERVNRARVDVGMEPMSVLLQTQADVAAREFDVADAEAQLILAQDLLLSAMAWGMEDDYKDWDRPIMPAESPSYDAEIRVSDSYAFQQALVRRPDYLSAEKDLDIADINRRVARQQRLPELNAFGGYNSTGLDDSWSGSWGDTTEMRYEGYNFGAEFRFPLFNRARRGQYRQAVDLFERAENVLLRFELQIRNEVRDSTRGIRTALVQIEASQRRVKAAEENLISETRRLEVGESTTF